MAVEAFALLKDAFSGLKTDVGKKMVGIFFGVQVLNFAGTTLARTQSGMASSTTGLVVTLLAAVLGAIATIGGLRAFREKEIKRKMFTENILWPFGRLLGANIVTMIFAYGLGILALLPLFMAGGLSGIAPSGLTGASILVIGLGGLGILLGVSVFMYVLTTFIITQPLIAIDDRRLFQALDESVQRTRGERISVFFAFTGLVMAYLAVSVIVAIAASFAGDTAVRAATTLVAAPVMTSLSLCLLNELSEQLPEMK